MNAETLLYRQVNPSWVQQGRVTSQAFKPTPKDEKLLSVYDGDQISAEQAWLHYTKRFESAGVLAVSVADCAKLELPVWSDPIPFAEHAVIGFEKFNSSQIEKKSKLLRCAAEARGWQYRAEGSV